MTLHCGGRVPVSRLPGRDLRTGGVCEHAGGCKQKGTRRGWAQEDKSGEGAAWRSQVTQRCHGAPLRREGSRELVVVKIPADGRGSRVCRGL